MIETLLETFDSIVKRNLRYHRPTEGKFIRFDKEAFEVFNKELLKLFAGRISISTVC